MADPDFRALCSQLVRLIEQCPPTADVDWITERMRLLYEVRTALKRFVPEPPTDERLTALVRVFQAAYNAKRAELRALPNPYREDTASDMADHAGISAVLSTLRASEPDDVDDDYWAPTEGNAKQALHQCLALAMLQPDGVWDGD